jgi:uncharacterized membrane protein
MSTTLYHARLTTHRPKRVLNVWLWIAQTLLGVFFLAAGYIHAIMPIEQAAKIAPWIATAPVALVRFIGVAELAGAIGVAVPAATRVKPWLTPLAAAGLALIMVLAMPVHMVRGEANMLARNAIAFLLAASAAWGRATAAPAAPQEHRS